MSWIWPYSAATYAGFDLGRSAVKAVQLSHRANQWTLDHASCAEYSGKGMLDAVDEAIGQFPFRIKKAAVSLPIAHTDIQHLPIPNVAQEDRLGLVRFEMAKKLDYPLEDACIDYTLSNRASSANGDGLRVVAFAYRRRDVKRILDVFASRQIAVSVFDVAPMALLSAVSLFTSDFVAETVLALDIGKMNSLAVIASGGLPLFVRNLPMPLSLRNPSDESGPALHEYLAFEIQRTLEYCKAHIREVDLDCVYVTGGGALVDGLSEALQSQLSRSVQRLNLLSGSSAPMRLKRGRVYADDAEGLRLSVAAGLAVRLAAGKS